MKKTNVQRHMNNWTNGETTLICGCAVLKLLSHV